MSNLSDSTVLGTCSYNGYEFSGASLTKSIRVRPHYDEAGRTTVYSVYEITIQDWIDGGDAEVQTALRALVAPAGVLRYSSRGLGGLTINTGKIKDVMWGPKPKILDIDTGSRRQGPKKLVWSVEVCVPTCADAKFESEVMEFNYEAEYEIDRDGLTNRSYIGFIRVPQTRQSAGERTLKYTADKWREKINIAPIPGFRRTRQTFRLSKDKCRLDFTIIDEQMGLDIPPPGVLEIDGPGVIYQSDPQGGTSNWLGTIALNYRLSRTATSNVAVKHFWDYVKEKTSDIPGGAIPLRMTLEDPGNWRRDRWVKLSVGFVRPMKLEDLLKTAGMWQQVSKNPAAEWRAWYFSLPLGPRGAAGIAFNPGDDAIVDLCGKVTTTRNVTNDSGNPTNLPTPPAGVFPPPKEEGSWIAYRCAVRLDIDTGVSTLRRLPEKWSDLAKDATGGGVEGFLASIPIASGRGIKIPDIANRSVTGSITGAVGSKSKLQNIASETQKRTTNACVLFMEGYAIRAGYPIPSPRLDDVGGVVPNPANRMDKGEGFTQAIIANAGVPVWGARWRMRYTLDEEPNKPVSELVPKNPLFERQDF